MTSLELILSEILEKSSARRLRRRAGKPDGSQAKNFLPKNPSIFCPLADFGGKFILKRNRKQQQLLQ